MSRFLGLRYTGPLRVHVSISWFTLLQDNNKIGDKFSEMKIMEDLCND